MVSAELRGFVEAGVSILVGSRDARSFPECVRAVGADARAAGDELTVFVPHATGATTRANLLDNGRVAVCIARIADHHSLQLKGRLLELRDAVPDERALVEAYRARLAEALGWVGLPPRLTLRLAVWPCFALRFAIERTFDQTPGPGAGEALGAAAGGSDVAPRLQELARCFQGVMPSLIATCGLDGEPNVTYVSQVYYVDERHVALSCQFFNKTRRNVTENPVVAVQMYDPLTFEAYRLRLRFMRAETTGALFDTMADRIQVIASHTGMGGVFRLISADVYEVLSLEALDGFLLPADPLLDAVPVQGSGGPLTELRSLQVVSDRIARAHELEPLLDGVLTALDELFGFSHSMVLLADACGRLVTRATRGYGASGAAAAVEVGRGLIGKVAELGRMVHVSGMGSELRYGRCIRGRAQERGGADVAPEVPLPGLEDAQAQLALPLRSGERLVGVLALESPDPLAFDDWDEAFLQILANQIAAGIERVERAPRPAATAATNGAPVRRFVFYRNDDCVFLEGEYLVRNVPGRILWKLLRAYVGEGRTEFTNRELRLDPALGLPPIKDNLESRLILLRRRLEERCPEARLVPTGRGRFRLELACVPRLSERDTA